MLACNATGTHKLPAVFIYKFKNPRCIRNIDKRHFPSRIIGIIRRGCKRSGFSMLDKDFRSRNATKKRKNLLMVDDALSKIKQY